jgi:pteridine reductase
MTTPSHAAVALVTGSARRVGAVIAGALVDAGYRVWLHHHHSPREAEALAHELRARAGEQAVIDVLVADLADASQRRALAERVCAWDEGRLDLLVNNAASFEHGRFVDRDDDDLRRVLEVNLVAPLSLVRSLMPALEQAGGNVVNIVDVAGMHPLGGHIDHGIAKAALDFATRALAVELAPIRFNAIAPGTVAWPTDERHAPGSSVRAAILRQIPLGRIGGPDDVAEAVLYLARASWVTGTRLVVDGGRVAAIGADRL